jgi:hypothetical protein
LDIFRLARRVAAVIDQREKVRLPSAYLLAVVCREGLMRLDHERLTIPCDGESAFFKLQEEDHGRGGNTEAPS